MWPLRAVTLLSTLQASTVSAQDLAVSAQRR
jgi:hypothetical protein